MAGFDAMLPNKYDDFKESDPFITRAKHNKDQEITREYVTITCPHCNKTIGDLPTDVLKKKKSTRCKAHLEVCTEFKAKGGDVTPAPVRASTSELLKQMKEMEARAEARHRESMARLSQAFDLGDPDAQTENELVVRGKRKIDEAQSNVFQKLPKTDEAMKQYRVFLHPDKDSNYSPAVNELRKTMMAQLLEADKHRRA